MLQAKSGFTRGAQWPIGDTPLVLGRDTGCDVLISDRTVSRRHCTITRNRDGLGLEDLGSRNPALVNGRPTEQCTLKIGDEIALGRCVFVIAEVSEAQAESERRKVDADTHVTQSIGLRGYDPSAAPRDALPHSAADYVFLFTFSRELSVGSGASELHDTVVKHITARMGPGDFWVVRDGTAAPTHAIPDWLRAVGEEARSSQETVAALGGKPERTGRAAPLVMGSQSRGHWLYLATPGARFSESDTAIFGAMAAIAAPFYEAADRYDHIRSLNIRLRGRIQSELPIDGSSHAAKTLRGQIRKAAPSGLHVLILGETGTGKELVARAIHDLSSRSAAPYIVLNCAAIPGDLFESELFGHVRGAFTGAISDRKGIISQVHTGTLFLDEIGDLSAENQARLLRVIETGTYRPVGAHDEEQSDFRVIAATNKQVKAPTFRRDLFHRLSGFVIETPPLRKRHSDIPELAQIFADQLAAVHPAHLKEFELEALQELCAHTWPGNIRELRYTIERALLSTHGQVVTANDIRTAIARPQVTGEDKHEWRLQEVERQHIAAALGYTRGNVAQAARLLDISRSTLYARIRDLNLQ